MPPDSGRAGGEKFVESGAVGGGAGCEEEGYGGVAVEGAELAGYPCGAGGADVISV